METNELRNELLYITPANKQQILAPIEGDGDYQMSATGTSSIVQEGIPPIPPTKHKTKSPGSPQEIKIAQQPLAILTQPLVQDLALQYGKQLVGTSSQVLRDGITKYLPLTKLKYYFAVDTTYVTSKLKVIIFPFQQRDWSLRYENDGPVQPRYEINAPDLYIPAMAYITYILVASMVLGTQNRFSPEQIGMTASSAIAIWLLELIVHLCTLYMMQIEMNLHIFDLLAYSGYKFVGIIGCVFLIMIGGRTLYYPGLVYTNFVLAFFLVRSLKGPVLANCVEHRKRVYYLLFVAATQPFWSWWLTYHLLPVL